MVTSGKSSDVDIAVIGAGAAGVAAARVLADNGRRVRVLEARNRVGGRAHTMTNGVPAPLDLGCEWLHSANRNPLVDAAMSLGLHIDRTKPNWGDHAGVGFFLRDRADFEAVSSRFWASLEEAARNGREDRPASDFLERGNRWNPLIQAISSYYNGVELEHVSIIDLDRYVDTGINWRIAEGYGTFVTRAAAGFDVSLNCTVEHIDHSGPGVRIATSRGTLRADAAVVTLPTNVLASGCVRFTPEIPCHTAAAAALPLGLADKVFFEIPPESDMPGGHLFGRIDSAETMSFDLRGPSGKVVQGYVGGEFARQLEAEGTRAFEAEARLQLAHMLGRKASEDLVFLCSTAWGSDPCARGAYSHALPGKADARAALSSPVGDRLYFAGEACSREFFSTAHGAWMSGIQAARTILGYDIGKYAAEPSAAAGD